MEDYREDRDDLVEVGRRTRAMIAAVLADPQAKPATLRLALAIVHDMGTWSRFDDVLGVDTLAETARLSDRSIRRARKAMVDLEAIDWHGHRGRGHRARVVLPPTDDRTQRGRPSRPMTGHQLADQATDDRTQITDDRTQTAPMTGHVVSATREVPIPEEEAGPGLADRCLALLTPAPHRVEETRTEVGQLIDRHGQDLVAEVVDALAAGGWSGEYCNRDLRPHVEAALSHGTDNAARRWGADQWITEDETTVRARAQRRYPDRPRLVEAAVGGWRERHDEEAA